MSVSEINRLFDGLPGAGLDFEYCAVKVPVSKTVTLMNPMQSPVKIEINQDTSEHSCFTLDPPMCKLHTF